MRFAMALAAVLGSRARTAAIMGEGRMGGDALAAFLLENNPGADPDEALLIAGLYVEECASEGVDSDVAFAQMCLETGFLRFGGLVTRDMNNFCGLGSTGPGHPGESFPDERTGARAHVQHLKAYASTEPLVLPQVDPRFSMVVPRGRAPDVASLAGTWAADPAYGEKLMEILGRLLEETPDPDLPPVGWSDGRAPEPDHPDGCRPAVHVPLDQTGACGDPAAGASDPQAS
jgi:hypothetical protein